MVATLFHSARSAWICLGLAICLPGLLTSHPALAESALPKASLGKAAAIDEKVLAAFQQSVATQLTIPAGLKDASTVRLRVHLKLLRDGNFSGEPDIEASGGSEQTRAVLAGAAKRAVMKAAPFTMFPKDNYEAWKEVFVNFDTSQMNL